MDFEINKLKSLRKKIQTRMVEHVDELDDNEECLSIYNKMLKDFGINLEEEAIDAIEKKFSEKYPVWEHINGLIYQQEKMASVEKELSPSDDHSPEFVQYYIKCKYTFKRIEDFAKDKFKDLWEICNQLKVLKKNKEIIR
jgi:hypothetical protein